MATELRFAMRCQGSTKPIRKKNPMMAISNSSAPAATTTDAEGRFNPLGSYTSYGFVSKEPI